MLRKKIIISVFIFTMFFTGLLLSKNDTAMAASSNLSLGSRGTQVVQLQEALNTKGYECGAADGIFGPKTNTAVIGFQRDAGLLIDGIVGPQTGRALGLTSWLGSNTVSRAGSVRGAQTVSMVATGYDSSYESNYPFYGQPSFIGMPLQRGVVAVDPNVIPMGTRLYIKGYGDAIAADQGGAIKGNRVDLFFDSHQEAMDWGIKTVKVTILK
jgi:3D (Asp-Asp-Asp) domain-containing protein